MSKELYIAATPHETKVAIVEEDQLTEVYYERENEYTLAGSIYKGKVTRVLPGMQSAFVDLGLERDAFLYVTDFMEEEDGDEYVVTQAPAVAPHEAEERRPPRREQRHQEEPAIVAAPDEAEEGEAEASADGENAGAAGQRNANSDDRGGVRRWRGRRGRRRGRGDFRERRPEGAGTEATTETPEAPQQASENTENESEEVRPVRHEEPRHPRHEEPRHARREESRHGSGHAHTQEAVASEAAPHSAPMLLPGESLSKYRPEGESRETAHSPAHEPAARPVSSFRPSTEVTELPVTGWTGGGVLPGESLSKYRGSSSSAPVTEPAVSSHAPVVHAHTETPQAEHIESPVVARFERHEPAVSHESPAFAAPLPEVHEPVAHKAEAAPVVDAHVAEAPAASSWSTSRHDHAAEIAAPPAANVLHETTDEVEYVEEVVAHSETEEVVETLHASAASYEAPTAAVEVSSAQPVAPPPPPPPPVHELGQQQGLVEEEEIDEEEYDFSHFVADDDADLEEMEEETLAANTGVEIGEAVRDAHLEERVRGYEDLTGDLELEAGAEEDEEGADSGSEGELSEDDPDYEAQAELRAPAETAAFQQKPERSQQDRGGRFSRRRGGGGGGGNRRQRGGGGGGGGFSRQQHRPVPTISELLQEGQEILVQIAKEPIAKKGARITSHIALPGRFLVFMPTVNHVGVSRKISSEEERQRLKRILLSEKGTVHGGFIVRTAAGGASEEDLRADIRFLINLWTEIKSRSESSKPASLIYHDLNLVERILRDQVSANFSTVWVDSEQEYERVVRFLNRFQPSLVRRVKLYTKDAPLFEQFGIQEEINKALKSKVWLKSGGYIVINQTEALVAIDVNTGKYVGKTTRLEDTIVKTNVDAIQEIVRQIRLRDLGGIIVIDFIDMDERKNRQRVMQALEEALKADRAPSKVLQFNDFGLVAITRKRVKQSLERTLSTQCNNCTGTGMVKSPVTVCNEIYTEMRKMAKHLEGHDVLLRVNPEILKALKASNGRWLTELEELARRTIIVKSDPALHMEQFDIH